MLTQDRELFCGQFGRSMACGGRHDVVTEGKGTTISCILCLVWLVGSSWCLVAEVNSSATLPRSSARTAPVDEARLRVLIDGRTALASVSVGKEVLGLRNQVLVEVRRKAGGRQAIRERLGTERLFIYMLEGTRRRKVRKKKTSEKNSTVPGRRKPPPRRETDFLQESPGRRSGSAGR